MADSVDPEIVQCSKLFVRGQHRIRCPFGQKHFENRQQIALAIDSDPIRLPIRWTRNWHNVQNSLYAVNIAFGVHLAEKTLKIVNDLVWVVKIVVLRIGVARIRIGSTSAELTWCKGIWGSFSENFSSIR